MAIQNNRMYNDPSLAQAFGNLASAFAPPSGSDLSGYAAAAAKKAETARLAELFSYARDPNFDQSNFDRMGQASGQWTPSTGYYGVDTTATTARRGQDVSAATDITKQRMQDAAAMARQQALPITAAENATVFLPQGTEEATGLPSTLFGQTALSPGETAFRADGTSLQGAAKPLSETEFVAQIMADMTPEQQRARAMGSTPVETIVGADGTPQIAWRNDAVGQQPAPARTTGSVELKNYKTPGGATGSARFDPDINVWVDTQSGETLPAGTTTFNSSLQGGQDETGLGRTTTNRVEQSLIDLANARGTAVSLLEQIKANPSSQGIVGMVRGTAQDVMQTGGELGQFFDKGLADVSKSINEGFADIGIAAEFDPSLPSIELLSNLLAFQYAKTTVGERLSNETFYQARRALGLDKMFGNQADSTARLQLVIDRMDAQSALLTRVRTQGVDGLSAGAPQQDEIEKWGRDESGQIVREQ